MVFDIWRKIIEKGSVAVPTRSSAISPLGWVEIKEDYPELIPDEFRQYDIYSDPSLIRGSPFVRINDHYEFHVAISNDQTFKAWIDLRYLIESATARDWLDTGDDIISERAILTCSCGIPGCLGLERQSIHVSSKMVHWSIKQYGHEYEFFFERETYEFGLIGMLHDLVENGGDISFEYNGSYWTKETFDDEVRSLLSRHPYFKDMWNETTSES